VENHVHRIAQMGPRVLISESWYNFMPVQAAGSNIRLPTLRPRPAGLQHVQPDRPHAARCNADERGGRRMDANSSGPRLLVRHGQNAVDGKRIKAVNNEERNFTRSDTSLAIANHLAAWNSWLGNVAEADDENFLGHLFVPASFGARWQRERAGRSGPILPPRASLEARPLRPPVCQ
jgi:hypothetical protein